jgi:uncharacterized protein YciI
MPHFVRTILVTGPEDEVREAAAAHVEHLRGLRDRGKLRAAGRLGDDEGFLEIFEATDRKEAEEIARSSPLVEGGLGAWMVRRWKEIEL